MTHVRGRRAVGAVLAMLVVVAGCSSGGDSGGSGAPTASSNPGASKFSNEEITYGLAPENDDVTYQPDVVIVGGGADSIRSVSDDGIEWTIKGDAENIDKVEVGKVMFVTGRAVGRVRQVRDAGDDVAVALGPVDLTEVYRDAEFSFDRPFDVTDLAYVETPGYLEPVTPLDANTSAAEPSAAEVTTDVRAEPAVATETVTLPPLQFIANGRPAARGAEIKGSLGGAFSVALDKWSVDALWSSNANGSIDLTFRVSRTEGPLKFGGVLVLHLADPTVQASVKIKDGKVTSTKASFHGIKGVDVDLKSGSSGGSSDNVKLRFEVPLDFSIPVGAPYPFLLSFKQKFALETAFSAKNSTLEGHGKYEFDGDVGSGGAASVAVKTVESMLDSIKGVSVGVSGIVFSYGIRVGLGLGIPQFFAGPFAGATIAIGQSRGSDLGQVGAANLAGAVATGQNTVCRGVTLDLYASTGIAYNFSEAAQSVLDKVWPTSGKSVRQTGDF
ncbi:MAG TPA: hypothetical protein VFX21_13960, partial [Acidimicrobiia bacterium]|nr:hypothetical protein [Acidimicrobiia bacterium]